MVTPPPMEIFVPSLEHAANDDPAPLSERMTPKQAAAYLGVSESTLRDWRSQGRGPRYVKIRRVFYLRRDLFEYVARSVVDPL